MSTDAPLTKQKSGRDRVSEMIDDIVSQSDVFSPGDRGLHEHGHALSPRSQARAAGDAPAYPIKSSAMVRAYALPKDVPTCMRFDACLLHYVGFESAKRNPDLIWGVFGTDSMSRANMYASRDARLDGRRLYMMDLWYKVDRKQGGVQSIAENIRATGFINIQRMDADYRGYMLSLFLQRLEEEGDPEWEKLSLERSVDSLVAQRPMLIHWFMKHCNWVCAVQHTVYISPGVMLRIITLRRDPARYMSVHVRYHPEIEASVHGEPLPIKNSHGETSE